jgi:predicted HTH domain antitoxin
VVAAFRPVERVLTAWPLSARVSPAGPAGYSGDAFEAVSRGYPALKSDPFGGQFFTATSDQLVAMVGKVAAMRDAPLSPQATHLRWAHALPHRAAASFASVHHAFTLSGRVEGDGVAVKALQIEYPEELLAAMDEQALQALAREALMVKLYDLGKVSSGLAAQTLGLSRRQFLEVLSRYGVSPFDDAVEVEAEARRG